MAHNFNDNTAKIEQDILKEHTPKNSFLWRMFIYVFSSAKFMCSIFLGLSIVLSLAQPLMAFIWRRYVDNATTFLYAESNYRVQLFSLIGLLLAYWATLFFAELAGRFVYGNNFIEMLSVVQYHRLQEKFQIHLNQKVSNLHPEYLEVPKVNDIIKRSYDSVAGHRSPLQHGVIVQGYTIIAKVVSVSMVFATLFIFSPLLSIIVFFAPIPVLYTTYIHNKLTFKFSRDNTATLRELNYYQSLFLGKAMKEIKVFNLFSYFFSKWKRTADNYLEKERRNQLVIFLLNSINSIILNVSVGIVQIIAIVLLAHGELSIGALGAVFLLTKSLIYNTSALFSAITTFLAQKNESTQFFDMIDLKDYEATTAERPENLPHEKVVMASKLSYRYPLTGKYRLRDIEMVIHKGEKIAFVGENGAGKSTFVKLIAGMLEPSNGKIIVSSSGANNTFSYRYDELSMVFQEPNQYNSFTIEENILLGDIERKQDSQAVDQALSFVNFDSNLNKKTLLGKNLGGADLSGGQWQKLSIARAYYQGKNFYILDEPTSNLDPLVEADIFEKYMKMAYDKTIIFVTHRISMATLADRIVVFKNGRIVEDGSHEDLIAKGGEYSKLYSVQAQWYER